MCWFPNKIFYGLVKTSTCNADIIKSNVFSTCPNINSLLIFLTRENFALALIANRFYQGLNTYVTEFFKFIIFFSCSGEDFFSNFPFRIFKNYEFKQKND